MSLQLRQYKRDHGLSKNQICRTKANARLEATKVESLPRQLGGGDKVTMCQYLMLILILLISLLICYI